MPGAPLSLTSSLKLATQSVKGTAATTGFICGRFTQSNMQPVLDYIEAQDEHFCGVSPRATTRKSLSRPSGYVGAFGAQGLFYPDQFGVVLRGLGMDAAAPTGAGTAKTHVFTVGDRADAAWLTALYNTGDGADAFERRLTDARIEMWRLDGSIKGLEQVMAGFGITEDEAAGTETSTNEVDAMILPSRGSATVTIAGGAFTSAFRTTRLQIANTLDRSEQKLFAFKRDDLPTKGFDVTGILGRIDLDKDTYKKLYWGGTSGTEPVPTPQYGAITFKFEAAEMAEGVIPYSVEFVLPKVELRMGNFQSRGQDLIRFDLNFFMIDDVAEPLTINLVNQHSTQY